MCLAQVLIDGPYNALSSPCHSEPGMQQALSQVLSLIIARIFLEMNMRRKRRRIKRRRRKKKEEKEKEEEEEGKGEGLEVEEENVSLIQ